MYRLSVRHGQTTDQDGAGIPTSGERQPTEGAHRAEQAAAALAAGRSAAKTGHAVVIAGGGPTGLMLAGELALAGIDVAIVERRASREVDGARRLSMQRTYYARVGALLPQSGG